MYANWRMPQVTVFRIGRPPQVVMPAYVDTLPHRQKNAEKHNNPSLEVFTSRELLR